jgi:S-adenosylmethionine hydrolase
MFHPIITLTTDFGLRDPYVAEMKAVILSISPEATIVDVSHEIEKFNKRMGAYVLASAAPYFPKGTIHLAIVDPSVGTSRQPIMLRTRRGFFIGPNNGVLTLAARREGIIKIHRINNPQLMRRNVSNTFHGRDIFAPAAAYLANETPVENFGPRISKIVIPTFARVTRKDGVITGEIMYIDDFGNIVTNLTEKHLTSRKTQSKVDVKIGTTTRRLRFCKAYGDVDLGKPLILVGSHDFLEVAINQGNAARKFKTKTGDRVTVYLRY